jgi:hypothetical protein
MSIQEDRFKTLNDDVAAAVQQEVDSLAATKGAALEKLNPSPNSNLTNNNNNNAPAANNNPPNTTPQIGAIGRGGQRQQNAPGAPTTAAPYKVPGSPNQPVAPAQKPGTNRPAPMPTYGQPVNNSNGMR